MRPDRILMASNSYRGQIIDCRHFGKDPINADSSRTIPGVTPIHASDHVGIEVQLEFVPVCIEDENFRSN